MLYTFRDYLRLGDDSDEPDEYTEKMIEALKESLFLVLQEFRGFFCGNVPVKGFGKSRLGDDSDEPDEYTEKMIEALKDGDVRDGMIFHLCYCAQVWVEEDCPWFGF